MSSTESRDSRRPRAFAILMVVIVGSMWWMADARSTIERATTEAAEYGRPLPSSFAAGPSGGDDSLVFADDAGPRHGESSTFFADGEDWTGPYEAM
jgi:hypothetical protein